VKTYGEMTPAERERAWAEAERLYGPFGAPFGFTEWAEANETAPAAEPTRREQRWGARRHGWQRRPR